MIWVTLRDLRWRARRIALGVLATASVLAMTLLLLAVHDAFLDETTRTVEFFGADEWVVPAGIGGPFTTNSPLSARAADQLRSEPGVQGATPVAIFRHVATIVGTATPVDVNVIAYRAGDVVVPRMLSGRAPERPGETAVDQTLGVGVGADIEVAGQLLHVVGVVRGLTYNGGTPTVLLTLGQGQQIAFDGRDLASSIVVKGTPGAYPDGLEPMTPREVRDDLRRPLQVATRTLAVLAVLLWVVAAGIVAFVCYISGLDRLRDIAVFKAFGAPTRTIVAGTVLHGILISGTAALIAIGAALLLVPTFPLPVAVSARMSLQVLAVGVLIGVCASALSVRQAVAVDPALAFANT